MVLTKAKRIKKPRLINFNLLPLKSAPRPLLFLGGIAVGFLISENFPLVPQSWSPATTKTESIRACFSPEGHCTNGIINAIQSATSSIYVQAYSFTSTPIAEALVEAKSRDVGVRVLIDKSQLKDPHSQLSFLAHNGIPILIDSSSGLAHNKVMIFDSKSLLTGSFNFTKAAESRNAENVLIIHNPELASIYKDNWERRARRATGYKEEINERHKIRTE